MGSGILRTVQIGISLIVLTAVTVVILMILGLMSQESALRIGLNVTAIIGVCVIAGVALGAVFGMKNDKADGS